VLISPAVRARSWLGFLASLFAFGACSLTTELDGLSSGGLGDAGRDQNAPQSDAGPPGSDGGSSGSSSSSSTSSSGGPTYADLVLADKPTGYFPFDEPAGSELIEEKISGRTAKANLDDFTPGAAGVAGSALKSSGRSDLRFGDILDTIGAEPWTIEAWVKPEFDNGKVFYEYFNKRADGSNGIVAYVRRENGNMTVQVEQSFSGGGRGVDAELPSVDRFTHVVFVFDPGKTNMRVWIDGKVAHTGYNDNGGPTDNAQTVYIASGIKGIIDELAIYDVALPDDRIRAHFNAGKQP